MNRKPATKSSPVPSSSMVSMRSSQSSINIVVRCKEVLAMTGLSRSTLWRLQQDGRFPKPFAISPGTKGWLRSVVEAWLQERAAGISR